MTEKHQWLFRHANSLRHASSLAFPPRSSKQHDEPTAAASGQCSCLEADRCCHIAVCANYKPQTAYPACLGMGCLDGLPLTCTRGCWKSSMAPIRAGRILAWHFSWMVGPRSVHICPRAWQADQRTCMGGCMDKWVHGYVWRAYTAHDTLCMCLRYFAPEPGRQTRGPVWIQ
jgi:hypothetical protein